MAELTEEQIAQEEDWLKGLPRFNWAAFLMPPIWGPAHGIWVTILYYPAWLLADDLFYETFVNPNPMSILLSILAAAILLGITVGFAIASQPFAAHRAESLGVDRETYLRRQKYWTVGCAIAAGIMLVLATMYNIEVRPTLPEIVE